ncbi:hypothetical protein CLOM_g13897 [Closterium sp. NIES-68]|nr:hypothetical protein CLOM_g13897 [Closterium sp. NIES-68]
MAVYLSNGRRKRRAYGNNGAVKPATRTRQPKATIGVDYRIEAHAHFHSEGHFLSRRNRANVLHSSNRDSPVSNVDMVKAEVHSLGHLSGNEPLRSLSQSSVVDSSSTPSSEAVRSLEATVTEYRSARRHPPTPYDVAAVAQASSAGQENAGGFADQAPRLRSSSPFRYLPWRTGLLVPPVLLPPLLPSSSSPPHPIALPALPGYHPGSPGFVPTPNQCASCQPSAPCPFTACRCSPSAQ